MDVQTFHNASPEEKAKMLEELDKKSKIRNTFTNIFSAFVKTTNVQDLEHTLPKQEDQQNGK